MIIYTEWAYQLELAHQQVVVRTPTGEQGLESSSMFCITYMYTELMKFKLLIMYI